MKRLYSLKGRNLFKEVYQKGKKLQNREIQIFFLRFNDLDKSDSNAKVSSIKRNLKIGISVIKKYGNAYTRNTAKRQIRSICNELLNQMNDGFYFILRPNENFKNISYKQALSNMRALLIKARVIDQ